ncbi:MAG: SDR family oxidoreductase [Myxococcota bacterium]
MITGASRGIGAGLANHFAAQGMKLALCARGPCTLPDGGEGITARVDVSSAEAVGEFAELAARELGPIDLWINNAGVLEPVAPLREISPQAFMKHLEVNLMGVVHGCQSYIAHLRGVGHKGVLINISSGAAWGGYAGWAPYCVGKAGVDRLSETIQLEEGEHLRVYAVAPGIVDTDMQALIRSTSREAFPMIDKFLEFKEQNAFNTIPFVADHLLRYAFDTDARPDAVTVRIPNEVQTS